MKYTPNYSYKQPERTVATNDPADINDLADNWGRADKHLKDISDAHAATETLINAHVANKANPHNTTAAQVDTYTKQEIDARDGAFLAHVSSTDNPHSTTAAQVGAYSRNETNELLAGKVTAGDTLAANHVLVTNADGEAVTAQVTGVELAGLLGVTGNIQEQLDNIEYYNYLSSLPVITLLTGGDSFPAQPIIDLQVTPLLEEAYPEAARRDAVIQNVQTQNGAQRKAMLYCYYSGTQSGGFVGWRYITDIDTLLNRANGEVYGVVRDSGDISFLAGEGTVHHATQADKAAVAHGLKSLRPDVDIGTDEMPFRTVYAGTLHSPAGNATLQAQSATAALEPGGAFSPGINGAQDLGTPSAKWHNGHFAGDVSAATSFTLNGDTITSWPACDVDNRGRKYATLVVGTTRSGHTLVDCDYLCDGTADQVEINAAIAALPAAGGTVLVLEGTYNLTNTVVWTKHNITLQGMGKATTLSLLILSPPTYTVRCTGSNCTICDLSVVTNRATGVGVSVSGEASTVRDIYVAGASLGINAYGKNCTVEGNCCVENENGIVLQCDNGIAANNKCTGIRTSGYGIFATGGYRNTLTGNVCTSCFYGLFISAYYVSASGNACNNNQIGIYNTNYYSVIAGNNLWNNAQAIHDGGNVSAKGLNGGAT